jgi:class 3 adenylate cyclase
VTFLFTDVEGSTRRWEADADAMRAALAACDVALRAAIGAHGGYRSESSVRDPLTCRK